MSEALLAIEHPRNQDVWRNLPRPQAHNVLLEQYLLWAHLSHPGTAAAAAARPAVEYLFPSMDAAFTPRLAAEAGFTHLMGAAKQKPEILDKLRRRVTGIAPRYAERARQISAELSDLIVTATGPGRRGRWRCAPSCGAPRGTFRPA